MKGFTSAIPGVPDDLRGTYAGLASDAAVASPKDLGVTAVELLPVHHIVDEHFLLERGLTNYWGYNTLGFFAPARRLCRDRRLAASRSRVQGDGEALHAAGIEVILDVVYNHTAEGNHSGPTLSFRGVDNATYYWLVAGQPALLHGLHRHAATRSTSRSPRCCS